MANKITGKPSLRSHVDKMHAAVHDAIKADPRFATGKNSEGQPAASWNKPYVVDVTMPDAKGKHEAVIRTDNGRLVKHGFDYDAEAGTATMDKGDSDDCESNTVYTKQIEEHDEAVKAVHNGFLVAKDGKGHLPTRTDGKADHRLMGAAWAALHGGFRGNKYEGPDKSKAIAKLKKMYEDEGVELPSTKARDQRQEAVVTAEDFMTRHKINAAEEIFCRALTAIDSTDWKLDAASDFMWMPGGVTTVQAGFAKRPIRLTVDCNEQTAVTAQASFDAWSEELPKLKPFICVEHREEEAAAHPQRFEWKDGDDAGVYCSVMPTGLGVKNVNERIHRSFSPSFFTDADYGKMKCSECSEGVKKCECNGCLTFPDGMRGSETNPAQVTHVGFVVGSMTNRPAFRNIAPVKAVEKTFDEQIETIFASLAEQARPPEQTNNGANNKGTQMKLIIIKAHGEYKVGAEIEVEATQAATLIAGGFAQDAVQAAASVAQANEIKQLKADRQSGRESSIKAKIKLAKDRGAIPLKDEAIEAKAIERLGKIGDSAEGFEILCETIDTLAGKDETILASRLTAALKDENGNVRIQMGEVGLKIHAEKYCEAVGPMSKTIKKGPNSYKDALMLASERNVHMMPFINAMRKNEDFKLTDVCVQAAGLDVLDPDSQVGTLATGLVIMRNLGFLKNKLGWLPYISTDLRNEPVQFGQTVRTRYITPPNLLTFVPGIGYTSDVSTITAAGGLTAQSSETFQATGTLTRSVPSATDVDVKLDQHKGVEIAFDTQKLGATMRNLFAEQQGAQFYTLAEAVNTFFLSKLFGATWTGIVKAMSLGAGFALPGLIKIKDRMTLAKFPDVGRFALLHSYFYDGVLTDTNLLNSKAILALINKDESAFDSAELPPIFGLKLMESQLASYAGATATPLTVDPATGNVTVPGGITGLGFAGNSASMCFVARVPQDYTQVLKDIPATAAVEILTEPDSGLSVMFVKYINHEKAQVQARCALMYGAAQGDPRQGIVLAP